MKNSIIILALFFTLIAQNAAAQYTIFTFDEELVQFNNHTPLASEKDFLVTGNIPTSVNLVEVSVFTANGKDNRSSLYSNVWRRPNGNNGTQYKVPMNYKLRANKSYDFILQYYTPLTKEAHVSLHKALTENLDTYIDQSFQVGKKKIKFAKKSKQITSDLNEIVERGLSAYRTTNAIYFNGFSDLVADQIANIERANLKKAVHIMDTTDSTDVKSSYRNKLITNLKKMVRSEVKFILDNEWNGLYKEYYIDNTKTEIRNGYFAVNFGYGAVYLSGDVDNLDYGVGVYAGLSFPLSTSTIAPKFFRNASITTGVFLNNFEDEDRQTITGPIIKRPIYVGLDYRLFQFVRFNAGAAFLEEESEQTGQIGGITNRVFVQPFVGLSAKINLSVGLDK